MPLTVIMTAAKTVSRASVEVSGPPETMRVTMSATSMTVTATASTREPKGSPTRWATTSAWWTAASTEPASAAATMATGRAPRSRPHANTSSTSPESGTRAVQDSIRVRIAVGIRKSFHIACTPTADVCPVPHAKRGKPCVHLGRRGPDTLAAWPASTFPHPALRTPSTPTPPRPSPGSARTTTPGAPNRSRGAWSSSRGSTGCSRRPPTNWSTRCARTWAGPRPSPFSPRSTSSPPRSGTCASTCGRGCGPSGSTRRRTSSPPAPTCCANRSAWSWSSGRSTTRCS